MTLTLFGRKHMTEYETQNNLVYDKRQTFYALDYQSLIDRKKGFQIFSMIDVENWHVAETLN